MVAQPNAQDKREFRVLGIDQALRNVGICLNGSGALEGLVFRELKSRGAQRLSNLRRRILASVDGFKPRLIAFEGYSIDSTNRPFDLGEIGGILRVEFLDRGYPFIVVPPKTLKKFATGSGSASKERVMAAVLERYGFDTDNNDIADAVALSKFAEVYLFGKSKYRSELDGVRIFKEQQGAKKKRIVYASVQAV